MLHVKYFTSALENNDFDELQTFWSCPLNTSNQIYHNRMIKSLSLTNSVTVFSNRPYNKKFCTVDDLKSKIKEERNIIWNYLPIEGNPVKRFLKQRKLVLSNDDVCDVVFADCLNLSCLQLARSYAKKRSVPLIGVLTDNPSTYKNNVFTAKCVSSLAKKCDGYVCVTQSLAQLVNKNNKPFIQITGITEDMFREVETDQKKYKKYFFYAGAIDEKHGIYKLIDAFKELNRDDINLVVCGPNTEKKFDEEIEGCKNIFFIGTLPNLKLLSYECGSIANVNPKIYNKLEDKYTVPSKTIEFLGAASLTISTYVKDLYPDFRTSALWVDDDYPLVKALNEAVIMADNAKDRMVLNANTMVHEKFSQKATNSKLTKLLKEVIK